MLQNEHFQSLVYRTFLKWVYCQRAFGTKNDVVSTSMRRNHVASTLIRRHCTSCTHWVLTQQNLILLEVLFEHCYMYSGYTVVFDKRQDIRGVARRKPGSTDFNIFSSELNVNGTLSKEASPFSIRVNSSKEKKLLLQRIVFPLRVDPI